MPISQYSKIIPLELKEDKSSDILLASLDKKIKKLIRKDIEQKPVKSP